MPNLEALLAQPVRDLAEQDQPAWGWLEGLRRVGDSIYARMAGMPARFADLVRTRFWRRSGEFQKSAAGWEMTAIALLGSQQPAIPLKDVDPADTGGTIEDVEVLRVGTWPAKTGEITFEAADLDAVIRNWEAGSKPRIPIKLGHSERVAAAFEAGNPAVAILELDTLAKYSWDQCMIDQRARYGSEETAAKVCGMIKSKYGLSRPDDMTIALSEAEQALGMTTTTPAIAGQQSSITDEEAQMDKETIDKVAALERAAADSKAELAAAKAAADASKAELERLKTEQEAQKIELARRDATSQIDALFLRLATPRDGKAIPIKALEDAGLRKLALMLTPSTVATVQLAAGETALTILERVAETMRTVQLGAMTTVEQGGADPDKAEFEAMGGEAVLLQDLATYKAAKAQQKAKVTA